MSQVTSFAVVNRKSRRLQKKPCVCFESSDGNSLGINSSYQDQCAASTSLRPRSKTPRGPSPTRTLYNRKLKKSHKDDKSTDVFVSKLKASCKPSSILGKPDRIDKYGKRIDLERKNTDTSKNKNIFNSRPEKRTPLLRIQECKKESWIPEDRITSHTSHFLNDPLTRVLNNDDAFKMKYFNYYKQLTDTIPKKGFGPNLYSNLLSPHLCPDPCLEKNYNVQLNYGSTHKDDKSSDDRDMDEKEEDDEEHHGEESKNVIGSNDYEHDLPNQDTSANEIGEAKKGSNDNAQQRRLSFKKDRDEIGDPAERDQKKSQQFEEAWDSREKVQGGNRSDSLVDFIDTLSKAPGDSSKKELEEIPRKSKSALKSRKSVEQEPEKLSKSSAQILEKSGKKSVKSLKQEPEESDRISRKSIKQVSDKRSRKSLKQEPDESDRISRKTLKQGTDESPRESLEQEEEKSDKISRKSLKLDARSKKSLKQEPEQSTRISRKSLKQDTQETDESRGESLDQDQEKSDRISRKSLKLDARSKKSLKKDPEQSDRISRKSLKQDTQATDERLEQEKLDRVSRKSLKEDAQISDRRSRKSIKQDTEDKSPRESLQQEQEKSDRISRKSFKGDARSRKSLKQEPEESDRVSRKSLKQDAQATDKGPRESLKEEPDRISRKSLKQDTEVSPESHREEPEKLGRASRKSLKQDKEALDKSPRGSLKQESEMGKISRKSLVKDADGVEKSPSLKQAAVSDKSPRGSLKQDAEVSDKSPRASLKGEPEKSGRISRKSLKEDADLLGKSPRGSLKQELEISDRISKKSVIQDTELLDKIPRESLKEEPEIVDIKRKKSTGGEFEISNKSLTESLRKKLEEKRRSSVIPDSRVNLEQKERSKDPDEQRSSVQETKEQVETVAKDQQDLDGGRTESVRFGESEAREQKESDKKDEIGSIEKVPEIEKKASGEIPVDSSREGSLLREKPEKVELTQDTGIDKNEKDGDVKKVEEPKEDSSVQRRESRRSSILSRIFRRSKESQLESKSMDGEDGKGGISGIPPIPTSRIEEEPETTSATNALRKEGADVEPTEPAKVTETSGEEEGKPEGEEYDFKSERTLSGQQDIYEGFDEFDTPQTVDEAKPIQENIVSSEDYSSHKESSSKVSKTSSHGSQPSLLAEDSLKEKSEPDFHVLDFGLETVLDEARRVKEEITDVVKKTQPEETPPLEPPVVVDEGKVVQVSPQPLEVIQTVESPPLAASISSSSSSRSSEFEPPVIIPFHPIEVVEIRDSIELTIIRNHLVYVPEEPKCLLKKILSKCSAQEICKLCPTRILSDSSRSQCPLKSRRFFTKTVNARSCPCSSLEDKLSPAASKESKRPKSIAKKSSSRVSFCASSKLLSRAKTPAKKSSAKVRFCRSSKLSKKNDKVVPPRKKRRVISTPPDLNDQSGNKELPKQKISICSTKKLAKLCPTKRVPRSGQSRSKTIPSRSCPCSLAEGKSPSETTKECLLSGAQPRPKNTSSRRSFCPFSKLPKEKDDDLPVRDKHVNISTQPEVLESDYSEMPESKVEDSHDAVDELKKTTSQEEDLTTSPSLEQAQSEVTIDSSVKELKDVLIETFGIRLEDTPSEIFWDKPEEISTDIDEDKSNERPRELEEDKSDDIRSGIDEDKSAEIPVEIQDDNPEETSTKIVEDKSEETPAHIIEDKLGDITTEKEREEAKKICETTTSQKKFKLKWTRKGKIDRKTKQPVTVDSTSSSKKKSKERIRKTKDKVKWKSCLKRKKSKDKSDKDSKSNLIDDSSSKDKVEFDQKTEPKLVDGLTSKDQLESEQITEPKLVEDLSSKDQAESDQKMEPKLVDDSSKKESKKKIKESKNKVTWKTCLKQKKKKMEACMNTEKRSPEVETFYFNKKMSESKSGRHKRGLFNKESREKTTTPTPVVKKTSNKLCGSSSIAFFKKKFFESRERSAACAACCRPGRFHFDMAECKAYAEKVRTENELRRQGYLKQYMDFKEIPLEVLMGRTYYRKKVVPVAVQAAPKAEVSPPKEDKEEESSFGSELIEYRPYTMSMDDSDFIPIEEPKRKKVESEDLFEEMESMELGKSADEQTGSSGSSENDPTRMDIPQDISLLSASFGMEDSLLGLSDLSILPEAKKDSVSHPTDQMKSKEMTPEEMKEKLQEARESMTDKEIFEKLLTTYEKEEGIAEKLSDDPDFLKEQLLDVRSIESVEKILPLIPRSDEMEKLKAKDGQRKVDAEDIGRNFSRGFRSDALALTGDACFSYNKQDKMRVSTTVLETVSIVDFSERETPLDFLLGLGFMVDEATNALKDEDVEHRLLAAITEARVWINQITTTQGVLLYLVALKARPKIMRYFLQLVEAIINKRIDNAVRLDGFLRVLVKIEEGTIGIINIFGLTQFEDEDNEEKVVRNQLREVFQSVYRVAEMESARRNLPLSPESIKLLRILAAKYRAGLHPHLELIAKYIGQGLVNTEVQLEAAMIFLSRLDTADVKIKEFEKYCGIVRR